MHGRSPRLGAESTRPGTINRAQVTLSSILFLAGGLGLLVLGADWLVRGSARLALLLGISPLVVGLTVVAMGTSAPEAVVTVGAVLGGRPEVALGNVVGSNILNILLILGLAALIAPIAVGSRLLRQDVPAMVALSLMVYLVGMNGVIGVWEGTLLLGLGIGYTWHRLKRSRAPEALPEKPKVSRSSVLAAGAPQGTVLSNLVLTVAGFVLLVVGARWLVGGAVDIGRALGVSELVIGLTVVAGGTSVPELAASLLAALRGEREIAVGNVVGSNLYNLTLVLGLGGILGPEGIPVSTGVLGFDLPFMVIVAVACLPIFFTGARIDRWEGALFVGYYLAYAACLFLKAVDHQVLPLFSGILWLFVIPLTAVTLGVIVFREVRGREA
jgi:cation:H+ antiporter